MRDRNGHLSKWYLMSKIYILPNRAIKYMCIHTRLSAPKRFAKFGRQKQTFCKKMEEKYGQPSLDHTDYSQTLEDVRTTFEVRTTETSYNNREKGAVFFNCCWGSTS